MVVVDLHAGMPWLWVVGEGPPIVTIGAVFLVLLRGVGGAIERPIERNEPL
jgi:hypothetical protein